jgi:DNA polymerase I-like protein with 3'-5' exonuclease and polymerase domains
MKASDIETTGLLEQMAKQENPKLHNFCSIDVDTEEVKLIEGSDRRAVQAWLDEGHTHLMHNGKTFDGEALKLLGYDISKMVIIDTLALSWYLEPNRMRHGLAEYGEDFGIPKPVIENWEDQTQEEYNHRVLEDCKIQRMLWLKQEKRLKELYGDDPNDFKKIIAFLMQKMEELRQQQGNKWKLDVDQALILQSQLEQEILEKVDVLREAMPKVATYAVRKRPAAPFKKNGDMSVAGEAWKALTESLSLPFTHNEDIKVVTKWSEGNPGSHAQIKAWLDSFGWEPETFKFVREDNGDTRQIPQVNLKGGEICSSVKDLIPKCAGIEHIAGLGILNHRNSVVKGFLRDAVDGELIAGAQGFTNTLRNQHREIVNLPSLRVKYGKELRGLLVARKGYRLLGSDLSSLEDRLKHHFQWKLDPDYVKSQMTKGFDPHNSIAVIAGLMSQDEADFYALYKESHFVIGWGEQAVQDALFVRLDEVRAAGKSTNYACQYGAGVKTVARTAKVSERVAKKLHQGYHKLNWSIAKIASMTKVKSTTFGQWQFNPISKMWYSLRSEKDRFSTLIQGSGAYILDLWLYHAERLAKVRGLEYNLLGQFHDELVLEVPEDMEDEYRKLVDDALKAVNNALKLNRELACDIKFGDRYSDIH